MKIILSSILMSILLSDGCKKDNGKSREDLLTQHAWKLEEITQVENNAKIYYKRGGKSNTANYNDDKIAFLSDGTGTYSPTSEETFNITWQFTDAQKTTMDIVITFNPALVTNLKCSRVEITDNTFFCVTNFANAANQPVMSTVYRTPL